MEEKYIIRELTTKEKILKALEEPKPMFGNLVGGFMAILLGTAALGIATKNLKEIDMI